MYRIFVVLFLLLFSVPLLAADENYVTVYNQNLGLVKQIRTLSIDDPAKPIQFTDVASSIIPTSVHLKSLTSGSRFFIAEQNYEYDLVNAEKILQRYIDQNIEVITDTGEMLSGKLLSKSGSSFVLQNKDGIKILNWSNKYRVNVPNLPGGLITRPTLIWKLKNAKKGENKVEVSYLTGGMSWHAEYVGVLSASGDQLDVESWVSVENNSGATFNNAKLKLVAGEIQRASRPNRLQKRTGTIAEYAMAEADLVQERSFFDYHMYEITEPTNLKNYQIKQIAMFPATKVKSAKNYVYDARKNDKKISVNIEFKNKKAAGLGIPLPAGVFRIYQKDKENLEFVGENRIDHTGRNEKVSLEIGKAFDLAAGRKTIDSKKISRNTRRETVETEFRNNKEKEDVTIRMVEHLSNVNWEIKSANFEYRKLDHATIEFNVPVKAGQKTKVQYTITYSW